MSKKHSPPHQRGEKGSSRDEPNSSRWVSADFRHCRPKRDWDAPPAEEDVSSIKEVSGCRAR